jgi:heme oxygenase
MTSADTPDAIELVRAATREAHDRLDRRLDLDRRLRSRADYAAFLADQLGLFDPLERVLAAADWTGTGIRMTERARTPLLQADLRDLGTDPDAVERSPVPEIRGVAEAFGCLYVLEGSRLGGRLILKDHGPRLGVGEGFAGRFFSAGASGADGWRSFRDAFSASCAGPAERDAAIAAAIRVFAAFEAWLTRRAVRAA